MAAAETTQRESLEKQLRPILAFLVPFFFVVTGAKVVPTDLASLSTLGALAVVTVLAIIGKLIGSGLGALSLGRKNALIVGTGMVPRGEVGIIIASLGQQAGIFTGATYAIIIAMSLLTSMVAPPVLGALIKQKPGQTGSSSAGAAGPSETTDAADVELLD
jgi:Kef-type K+ transport system membrane component KefB